MLLVLTMTFSKSITWLEYQVNRDFISKNLCVNKFKPLVHCKGKCQLIKKMAGEQENDPSTPVPKLKAGIDETALPASNEFNPVALEIKMKPRGFLKKSSYTTPVFPVFHPPA